MGEQKEKKIRNVKWQPLYDSMGLVTAVARDYEFFKLPVGGLDGAVTKTRFHTNNDISGQIQNRCDMRVYAFAVSLWTNTAGGVPYADARNILEGAQAIMTLQIRNVTYFELPLYKFTSGHGLQVNSATTAAATTLQTWTNGNPQPKQVYTLVPKPVLIPEQTPFSLTVRFESAPTIATAAVRMFVFMEGILREPVYK